MFKDTLKIFLLKHLKNIELRKGSRVNFTVTNNGKKSEFSCEIINSDVSFTTVNEGCIISESKSYGDVRIGRFASITGPGTVIKALIEYISIGSFSSIGQNVCIIDFNHNSNKLTSCFINYLVFEKPFIKDLTTKGPVIIEEDVFVGSNSIILSGVTIGRGSIIGGGSVVTSDIPKYSIAFGNPSKAKKKRFKEDVIELLEEIKWWDWDTQRIQRNHELFNANLNELSVSEIRHLIND